MQVFDIGGKLVDVDGELIPAVNIQVDGFPKFQHGFQYGIYFEIMFETGHRWEVNKLSDTIDLEIYEVPDFFYRMELDSWEEFLNFYRLTKI